MFDKFLKVPKFSPFPGRGPTDPVKRPATRLRKHEEGSPYVVRIIHAGAKVEVYFMAIPAYRIMEKYPSHFVTRPEVFRRPWDAVVKPDEILALGKKYYVVPRRTVKKLRRRVLKLGIVGHDGRNRTTKSYVSRSLSDDSVDTENETYVKSCADSTDTSGNRFRAGRRKIGKKKRVRFKGIDVENLRSRSYEGEHNGGKGHKPRSHKDDSNGGKRKTKLHALTWKPSLAAITETHE